MITWEQSVEWLRTQPDQQDLVQACYYDDPLLSAAQRFAKSEEWDAVRAWLPSKPGDVLDLGAGRGISSYALACEGWNVTALEPDPGSLVGAGAIRSLATQAQLPITVIEEFGETLPFAEKSFDLVYGRQVLHHARDLSQLCHEVARVLRPGGRFIATREHVISRHEDLKLFLESHPLHHLYGGEHAYLLNEYRKSITQAGLRIKRESGPFDSAVNYFPIRHDEWLIICRSPLSRRLGTQLTHRLVNERHAPGRVLLAMLAMWRSRQDHTPGRLYSFVAEKYR